MPNIHSVEFEFDAAIDNGELIKIGLDEVFAEVGFNPNILTQYGALCIDVEFGPEIEALRPYNPAVLWVTEPQSRYSKDLGDRDDVITQVLELMATRVPNTKVIREVFNPRDIQALDLDPRFKPALITRLNMFPTHIPNNSYTLEQVKPLLAPAGLVLLSVIEHPYKEQLERVCKQGIEGYDLSVLDRIDNFKRIGSVVLAAKKVD